MLRKPASRRGVAAVEFAVVGPIVFLLLIGLISGTLGVFRYQQLSRLSRDASRWASVHGTQYATDTKKPAATAADVYAQVIQPGATGLDLSKLTYSVTWNTSNDPSRTVTTNGQSVTIANTVTVALTYQWIPEAYFSGVTMRSTSVNVMSY